MSKRWYVVQAYSGFEKNVQKTLKERIARENMEEYFGQILVPVEEVVDIKNGRKTISERKFYPGYVLVEMEMTDDSWHLVKSTPRVNGFVGGSGNRPIPISQKDADAILQQAKTGVEKPKPKVEFEVGQQVRVNEVHLPISMELLMKLTTSVIDCVFQFRFLVVKHRLNWSSVRLKRFKWFNSLENFFLSGYNRKFCLGSGMVPRYTRF